MTLVYCHKIIGLAMWQLTWQGEKMSQNEFWPTKAHIAHGPEIYLEWC